MTACSHLVVQLSANIGWNFRLVGIPVVGLAVDYRWDTLSNGVVRLASVVCVSHAHISKTKSDRAIVTIEDEQEMVVCNSEFVGRTAAAAPPPFRPSDPALCGSRPLVTPYYCRLGDLLCLFCIYRFVCHYCLCIVYIYI